MGVPFYIGMIAPFISIYVFNWIIFAIIIVSLLYKNWCKLAPSEGIQFQKSGHSARKQFMIAVTLSVLFGIGWGIGLLATEELGSKVAHYSFASLFVIITSFHGLLIFILQCARLKAARKEWRRWFFKLTRKEFSDYTYTTSGHIQHHLKTGPLRPLPLSSSSKTTEKDGFTSSTFSPFLSLTGDGRMHKVDMIKQCELESYCNPQAVEEETYERAMEPEMDTDFIKVDLARMEDKKAKTSNVNFDATSSDQVANDFKEGHCSVTITLLDSDNGEPKTDQSYIQSATEENKAKEMQQDEEQCPEEATPNKLNEQKCTKQEISGSTTALELVLSDQDKASPMPPAVKDGKA